MSARDFRVLIVGASGAIGSEVARQLDQDGFQLALHAFSNESALDELTTRLENQTTVPEKLIFDVASSDQARENIVNSIEKRGAFYGVALCSGFSRDTPFAGMKAEDWHQVISGNLSSFYNVLQPLTMPMIQLRKGGRIVVLSSLSGLVGNRGQVNYSAAKAGLMAASKALSKELAKRGITVNCIAPGFVESNMTESIDADVVKRLVPMQRMGTVHEIASGVRYLFSDGAGYITGQVLSANGGVA